MERICCLNPVLITITTCTMRNSTTRKEAKKCMVRADCAPKNIVSKNGQADAIFGDIVNPVNMMTGIRKKSTMK